ncbi:peptidylprolyl isomerase [Erythrobacter sp.]|jgi:peptidylprolyl isomerase|uniref:peptidylprolyl isomerase n=1 Tax=Erythrobacter sp. TaxID=1042 RepID=UPI002EBF71EB|nr:peptidylprolyl isomerase [Erythrobacter sp.]
MKIPAMLAFACSLVAYASAGTAQRAPSPAANASPSEIVAAAPPSDWQSIAPEDLLVMTLAPDRDGRGREIVIQLMPEPFSQGWVDNIRTLARARWYDGVSVNRVQDNYVVQWGDPGHDNPEGEGIETKPLPEGLNVMEERDFVHQMNAVAALINPCGDRSMVPATWLCDAYASGATFRDGWPIAIDGARQWPIHCYGMVGVGRNLSPDTGTGAELYTVIGHAPRHLDRNIALVGRIIEGMEHMSSLPRGSGQLGFYTEGEAKLRTPIRSIRVASDLPEDEQPRLESLSTESETFARYAEARANRRDPFFIVPAGGADICNIPVPLREVTAPQSG